MKSLNIVLGPNDVQELLLLAAGTGKAPYRIQVTLGFEETTSEITTVEYYAVDKDLQEIVGSDGAAIRKLGCPYPPDCNDIKSKIANKQATVEDFKDCVKRINDKVDLK